MQKSKAEADIFQWSSNNVSSKEVIQAALHSTIQAKVDPSLQDRLDKTIRETKERYDSYREYCSETFGREFIQQCVAGSESIDKLCACQAVDFEPTYKDILFYQSLLAEMETKKADEPGNFDPFQPKKPDFTNLNSILSTSAMSISRQRGAFGYLYTPI